MTGPLYAHDCALCYYLGSDGPQEGEPRCNAVDMYVCNLTAPASELTFVRRYSSRQDHYGCLLRNYAGARYAENRRRFAAK